MLRIEREGSPEELLSWFKINMEYTQNTIIDLNLAIHNLKMSGKDDLNIDHVLRMSETYLKKYLRDQEKECGELLKRTMQSQIKRTPAKIYQFKKKQGGISMNHNHAKQFTATDLLNDLVTNGRTEKQNKSIEEALLLMPEMLVIAMDYIMSEFDYKKSMRSSTAIGLRMMAAATVTLIETIETMPDTVEIQKAKNSETN